MRKMITLFFLLILTFGGRVCAQTTWIEDREMNFKIAVPVNYQANQFMDGSDKIHAFVSPDQNVAIQIRSFKANANLTVEVLKKAFLENYLKGAQLLVDQVHTINGINGQLAGYKWKYNNINVVAGVFYSLQNGMCHVIMTIIPENLFAARNAESDAITNTFAFINNPSGGANSGGLGGLGQIGKPQDNPQEVNQNQNTGNQRNQSQSTGSQTNQSQPSMANVQVTDVAIGTDIDANYRITSPQTILSSSVGRINLAFGYTGNAKGARFLIKWYSVTQNTLVKDFVFVSPDASTGRGQAYIENPGKPWPVGKYRAEIRLNDKLLNEISFSIAQDNASKPLNSNVATGSEYISLTSADACVEHLIPKNATIRQAEQGQKTWNVPEGSSGKNLTMVIQNILKQGRTFNAYMNELISGITSKGATLSKKEFGTLQGLSSCKYWYAYNGTEFLYTAVDGPQSFYLLGFVGPAEFKPSLERHTNTVSASFKKVACANVPTTQVQENTTPATGGSGKQIVLDNQNCGYDFATGKIRAGHQPPDPDVLNEAWCTPRPALCGNWAKTGKSRMEDVTSPPASGYISDGKDYANCQECPLNEVLVFKLKNGTYAKLMIIKDENTKTSTGCQHKITCVVKYPAF